MFLHVVVTHLYFDVSCIYAIYHINLWILWNSGKSINSSWFFCFAFYYKTNQQPTWPHKLLFIAASHGSTLAVWLPMVAGVPWLIGGSADLATSCLTTCNGWDGWSWGWLELVGGVEPWIYCSYNFLLMLWLYFPECCWEADRIHWFSCFFSTDISVIPI